MEFTELLSLGVGGVVAGVVLYWKRIDDKANEERLKGITDDYRNAVGRITDALESLKDSVGDNTKAIEQVATLDKIKTELSAKLELLQAQQPQRPPPEQ